MGASHSHDDHHGTSFKDKWAHVKLPENPQSVADFGYTFSRRLFVPPYCSNKSCGQTEPQIDILWVHAEKKTQPAEYKYRLVKKEDGEKFEFQGQKHYDALNEMVSKYIGDLMVSDFNMNRLMVPEDSTGPKLPIFLTQDALKNRHRLMVIFQGAGSTLHGQWARSVCINDSLDKGSILPYLVQASKRGYGVIVANPNEFFVRYDEQKERYVRYRVAGADPESHFQFLWDNYISKAKAKEIVIVAHSYGGVATYKLFTDKERQDAVAKRVVAVAFTDSVHWRIWGDGNLGPFKTFWKERVKNWAMSDEPLDTPLKSNGGCINVSSGHKVHEYTSWSAMDSVFAFLDSMVTPISASKIDKILAIQRGEKTSRRKSAAADAEGAADGVTKSDNENGGGADDVGESTGESSGKISKRKERAKSRLSIPPMATPPPDDNIFSPRSTSDE